MSSSKTYEMLWDCRFCGSKKLLGKTHRFCPNCGAAQDPSWRYFPSDAEKVAVEDHVYVGADKLCPSCSAVNAASANNCGQCGSPLDAAKAAQVQQTRMQAAGIAFQTEDVEARIRAQRDADAGVKLPTTPAPKPARRLQWWQIALPVIGVLLCIGALVVAFWTRETTVVVTGHNWSREIRIEDYQSRVESAWDESVPADAYNMTCRREQRGSRQVPDGQDCSVRQVDQGDGTFRQETVCETRYRDEPIYDQRCTYSVDRWGYARSALAQGDSLDDRPYWPDVNLRCTGQRIGCEREGQRIETYNLLLRGDGGATYTCGASFDIWSAARIESAFTLQVGAVLGDARCDTLQPR